MSDVLTAKSAYETSLTLGEEYSVNGLFQTEMPFRPVRCSEAQLEKLTPVNGYLYFATDVQKIFYGHNGEFVSMGGNSGIYYAHKAFEDSSDVAFDITDFDDEVLPNINDLIINVSTNTERDGFYKVIEIESETRVITSYLPVGGGGSGGGGGTTTVGTVAIGYVSPQVDSTITGVDYYIEYTLDARDSNGDPVINSGTATWRINGKKIDGGSVINGNNKFNIGPYLDASRDTNTISLQISINTGGIVDSQATKQWQITAVDLSLEWDWEYGEQSLISDSIFTIFWTPYGNVDCVTHFLFDNNWEEGYFTQDIAARQTGRVNSKDFISNDFGYGAHKLDMWVTANINGADYKTETITNEITIISGGTTPILTVPFYQSLATQYDTIQIPFVVYDPRDTEPEVQFLINDNVVSTDNYDRTLHHWTYTLGVSGSIKFELRSGVTTKSFEMQVVPLALDVEEVSGRKFALKASDFSGNDGIRAWSENGVNLTFSDNFDWKNGGLKTELDENGYLRKYILVKNGTWMQINYNLFGNEAQRNGKNFKVIFKATRCYNYDASILNCFNVINESTGAGIGLRLNAQNATFNSSNVSMTTQYCEDSYIELETEIWKGSSTATNPDNFIMYWIDGIPAQVKVYDYNDIFQQPSPQPIVIGSNECDVQIYLVKVYEKQLNEDEHLDNFIIDAPNTEEMLARYNRNNILDNSGEISYSKLAEKNPNCLVHTYRMDRMTMNKKDKITGCDYAQYHGDPIDPILTASNVTVKVQGTSSAAYGVAAFNIDSDFTEGFTDKDGNHLDGWSMSDTAIPVDYTCTKVNVASCENTNNAITQEWYNEFQPYWDAHRRKTYEADPTKKYRDTMEFTMGVMFVQDDNPVETFTSHDDYPAANMFCDTKGYVNNPYYKQYAICNMGNSKDNVHIFHDNDNPLACCVEVNDNQNAEHWMTTQVDMTVYDELETRDPFYEFRYPDGNDEASTDQKQAFLDFVNWMCENNPAAATNEDLATAETYSGYTFKGFTPPGCDESSGSGISLAGYTENTYAGTYTTDSKERRMAKMLSECEDHLVMDSVLFHYLFIQRHTLVDNVAKNTFWSSEDLMHWDLTKDYDNDTANGNNNTGYLVYSYGLECLDVEDETSGKYVFNAVQSVWLQFCDGLKGAQEYLYQALASYKGASGKYVGAWDEIAYLNKHKEWQSWIPERCWIYDYFRKYIRPRRLGLDNDVYLKRLEGGKKTHQRNQYETYQRYYLDSKYKTGKAVNAKIDLRANNSNLGDLVTPLTTYIDCYVYAVIGGQTYHERIKRGQVCNLPVSELITSGNDSTCYYYCASMIQTIQNLQYLYTQYATLTSADKLLLLELGSDDDGYRNNNMTTADFGSNTMLQQAFVQNCGDPNGDGMGVLDLTNLTSLEELRINGSTYTGVNLPDGGVLKTAYINAVSQLRMKDLTELSTLVFDEGIYNKLNNVHISNCPIVDTYDIVSKSNLLRYYLADVNWTIDDNSLDDNKLISIDVLDKLLTATPETSDTRTSLTGNVVVNLGETAYTVDEFEIYNKYNKKFPNLKITYEGNVTIIPAIKITFMESDSLESDVLFEVLTDGSYTIAELISEDGPAGMAIETPIKDQTTYYTFAWNLTAEDLDWRESDVDEANGITHEALLITTPVESVTYLPIFTPQDRLYSVIFRDWDGSDITEDLGITAQVPYNTVISDKPELKYRYREPKNAESRYDFQGWISPEDYLSATKDPVFITEFTVLEDFIVYAYYIERSITEPNDSKLFNFNTTRSWISLKSDYKSLYQGSITLPAYYNSKPVLGISNGGFSEINGLKEVYFEEGNIYETFDSYAFNKDFNLEKIYLPDTLLSLGDYSFGGCTALTTISKSNELPTSLTSIGNHCFNPTGSDISSMKVRIEELPPDLTYLGNQAFYQNDGLYMTTIPKNITKIYAWTFSGCENVKVTIFGNDANEEDGNNVTFIGGGAFYQAGVGVTEVYIRNSVVGISIINGDYAPFTRYAEGTLSKATITNLGGIFLDDGTPITGGSDLGFGDGVVIDSGVIEEA